MAVSLSGSVSESFSIMLHPASYWRGKPTNFISPPDFAYSTVALNICSRALLFLLRMEAGAETKSVAEREVQAVREEKCDLSSVE